MKFDNQALYLSVNSSFFRIASSLYGCLVPAKEGINSGLFPHKTKIRKDQATIGIWKFGVFFHT
jgi:hypothetical protein